MGSSETWFRWSLGILVTIGLALMAILVDRVRDLDQRVTVLEVDVRVAAGLHQRDK